MYFWSGGYLSLLPWGPESPATQLRCRGPLPDRPLDMTTQTESQMGSSTGLRDGSPMPKHRLPRQTFSLLLLSASGLGPQHGPVFCRPQLHARHNACSNYSSTYGAGRRVPARAGTGTATDVVVVPYPPHWRPGLPMKPAAWVWGRNHSYRCLSATGTKLTAPHTVQTSHCPCSCSLLSPSGSSGVSTFHRD